MVIPTAKEAKERTESYDLAKDKKVSKFIAKIGKQIEQAIERCEYSVKIEDFYKLESQDTIKYVKNFFRELGYEVIDKKESLDRIPGTITVTYVTWK